MPVLLHLSVCVCVHLLYYFKVNLTQCIYIICSGCVISRYIEWIMLLKISHCWIINNYSVDTWSLKLIDAWWRLIYETFLSVLQDLVQIRTVLGWDRWRIRYQLYRFANIFQLHIFSCLMRTKQASQKAACRNRVPRMYEDSHWASPAKCTYQLSPSLPLGAAWEWGRLWSSRVWNFPL